MSRLRSMTRRPPRVLRPQLRLVAGVLVAVVVAYLVSDRPVPSTGSYLGGLLILGWVTIVAAVVPWELVPSGWTIVLPLLDVVAIASLTADPTRVGLGALMVFPLLWISRIYDRTLVSLGVAFTMVALWIPRLIAWQQPAGHTHAGITTATSTTIALAFVAALTYASRERVEAQRRLLQRQTAMLEEALVLARRGEETVRSVLDAVDFAVVGFEPEGQVRTVNRSAFALLSRLGISATASTTRLPLYAEDGTTPVEHDALPHLRALRGELVENEVHWLGHPGEPRAALSVTVRGLSDGRADYRVVLTARDVTQELLAVKARDDLVASVSHELRTPLSSIIGYVDLALEEDLPEETRRMLEVALSNSERMLSLINDMLATRALQNGQRLSASFAPTDLAPILRDGVAGIMPLALDRLLRVSVDVPDSLPLDADALRLRQVVDNLLSNAVKYNREGGRLQVTARRDGQEAVFEIRDTGRGMSAEEQRGLFERFYRAESVRGSAVHGSGLGLSITRDLIELHGGTIAVQSEAEVGTTVRVRLPVEHSTTASGRTRD